MSTPRELPSTYIVPNRSSREEQQRVHEQDHTLTTAMGGVLSEQETQRPYESVLDVGCGTGNWLIEFAKCFPNTKRLVGVDVSETFLEYARWQAEQSQVSDRVTFLVMDALRRLDFPNHSFDLVNQRLGVSWLRTWEWTKLLSEYQRVSKSGGIVRITEGGISGSNNQALQKLNEVTAKALYQSGHLFSPGVQGILGQISQLLLRYRWSDVQTKQYHLEFRAQTPEGERLCEDLRLGYRTIIPFLKKWTLLPEEYESLYQQMLLGMQTPDFIVYMDLETTWGIK